MTQGRERGQVGIWVIDSHTVRVHCVSDERTRGSDLGAERQRVTAGRPAVGTQRCFGERRCGCTRNGVLVSGGVAVFFMLLNVHGGGMTY